MISTRHGGDQAERHPRLRPEAGPGAEGEQRHGDHGRHEPAGDLIGQPLDRRAGALRVRDHLDDLGQQGVAPDLVGAHHETAGWLSVPAITLPPASLVTGMDSPVTSDSSSEERPSRMTPSTGTFSPGRTRNLSPT